jgi:hypothetical protein
VKTGDDSAIRQYCEVEDSDGFFSDEELLYVDEEVRNFPTGWLNFSLSKYLLIDFFSTHDTGMLLQ